MSTPNPEPGWLSFRPYRAVDGATQAYIVGVGLLIALLHNETVRFPGLLVGLHVALAVALHAFLQSSARRPGGPVRRWLRDYYPILLYTAFFRETGEINRMVMPDFVDPWFIRWEQRWFDGQPSLAWMARFPHTLVAEAFYTAYFSYYLMIAGTGFWLWWRQPAAFRHFITVVSVVFYACYLAYVFLPVIGPRVFTLGALPPDVAAEIGIRLPVPLPPDTQAGPVAAVMRFLYHYFEAFGAAFPSSHVVIAWTTLRFTWSYVPAIRWLHLAAVVALCLATIYCRYHYVVDVLAGTLVAAVLVPAADRWYRKSEGRAASPA